MRELSVAEQRYQAVRAVIAGERAAPMELWQMDVMGGFLLADGSHAKTLTGGR